MKNFCDFTYRELFALAIRKPLLAQIEITKNCNQRCLFCFRSCSPDEIFKDKPIEDWKGAIDKLIKLGVEEINFSGGETFLYKNCNTLFNYAKKKGIKKIVVNTNGLVRLKSGDLKHVDELVFSIHGTNEAHDKITDITGSFDIAIKNLKQILKNKHLVGVNTVVNENNIRNLEGIYRYFKRFNLIYHSFNLSIDRSRIVNGDKKLLKLIPIYLKFIEKTYPHRLKLRHGMQNIIIKNKEYFDSKIPLPHCAGGKYKLVIDYLGNIYPCRFFQDKKYYCGNIFRGDLKKIWKSGPGFNFFRSTEYPRNCLKCLKKYKCLGGCLAWRIYNDKDKKYGKDIRCKIGDSYIRN